MRPAARIAAAIEVLDAVLDGDAPEKAFLAWSRRSRFAGSKDRAALRDIVFQSLRCRRSYSKIGGSLTGRGLVRGYMVATEVDEAEVFGAGPYAPPEFDDPPLVSHDNLTHYDLADLQDWVLDAFVAQYGTSAASIAAELREAAPIWLRVNTLKSTPNAVVDALNTAGHTVSTADDVPTALQVLRPARGLQNLPAAQEGWFEFQDLASQSAISLLGDLTGIHVLDYCAGGGGKSLALAAAGAAVTAHDHNPRRMADLDPRATRAGATINTLSTNALVGKAFDIVLCDVPCSGSGAWRRSVDNKWTLSPDDLAEYVSLQQDIVTKASAHLKPDGTLVYMTCSLFADENANQVRWIEEFLGYSLLETRQMTPLEGGDGFYVAVLKGKG